MEEESATHDIKVTRQGTAIRACLFSWEKAKQRKRWNLLLTLPFVERNQLSTRKKYQNMHAIAFGRWTDCDLYHWKGLAALFQYFKWSW